MRYSTASDKIRIVLEFDEIPDSFIFFSSLPKPSCEIALMDCSAGKSLKSTIEDKKDPLFLSISSKKRGYSSISVVANLLYPIPESNIKFIKLDKESPKRLVVDIYRDFSFKSSLPVTNGIMLNSEEFSDKTGYVRLCDLSAIVYPAGSAYLDAVIASGKGRQKVGEIRRNTPNAVAAVNGGFFEWGGGKPLGLLYRYGNVIAPHVSRRPVRSAFGIKMDGTPFIDRVSAKDKKIFASDGSEILNAAFVIGGGPRLVRDSSVSVNADEEELGKKGNDITRIAGRTAIGIGIDGKLHLVTASGWNDSHSEGMKLEPFAEKLISCGITSAVNLDGGGSSAMDISGTDVSKPAGKSVYERPVGNAVCLMTNENSLMPYDISDFQSSKDKIKADGIDFADCSFIIKDATGNLLPDGTKVKIIPSCGGFPFYAETVGGKVSFSIGKQKKASSFSVFVECGALQKEIWKGKFSAGEPSKFFSEILPNDPKFNDYFRVAFSSEDSFGNRISDVELSFTVKGDSDEEVFSKTIKLTSSSKSIVFFDKSLAGRKVSVTSDKNEVFSFDLPVISEESTDSKDKSTDSEDDKKTLLDGEKVDEKDNTDSKTENSPSEGFSKDPEKN